MWICNACNTQFVFPDVRRPDAGPVSCEGILGFRKMEPVRFCPKCFSTDIRQNEKAGTGEGRTANV